jgi:hypothetical protein
MRVRARRDVCSSSHSALAARDHTRLRAPCVHAAPHTNVATTRVRDAMLRRARVAR